MHEHAHANHTHMEVNFWGQFSSSVMCVLGSELIPSGLVTGADLPSHLIALSPFSFEITSKLAYKILYIITAFSFSFLF